MNLGYYNMTYDSDEENKPKKNKQGLSAACHPVKLFGHLFWDTLYHRL